LLPLSVASLPAADWQVWTVQDTRRVLREDPAGTGLAVKLAAARNEWESFQILLRSPTAIDKVNVELGPFKATDGTPLPGARLVLYRAHQLQLTDGTYRNTEFRPGWYPDPLIPALNPDTGKPLGKARFAAVPFDLPADQTHGFLVDVYVPPLAKAGVYQATCRVTARGDREQAIPVELTVWDFALPRVPAMQTALGSPAERVRAYYRKRAKEGKEKEPTDWDAVEAQCAQLLSEHRINATPWGAAALMPVALADGKYEIPPEQIAKFRAVVDQYGINAFCIPHPRSAIKDPDTEREKLRSWLASWDKAYKELDRPQLVFYTYLLDEPNDEEAYQFVQKWGKAIRSAKTVVKVLVVEQTLTQNPAWGDLYGAVDIWCPLFSLHDPKTAAERQALGETLWTYTALCQRERTPWWHIDFPLLNYRVPAWIAWHYRMRGLLYWGAMSHWTGVEDPWSDPKTLDRRVRGKGQLYNGEGTIVYPARAVGYDGIAASLRLKALRDGLEDYDYLALLERQGRAAEAERVIAPLASSWFEWQRDPAAYQKARAKLAELIQRK
jgi:hypothetical protein